MKITLYARPQDVAGFKLKQSIEVSPVRTLDCTLQIEISTEGYRLWMDKSALMLEFVGYEVDGD